MFGVGRDPDADRDRQPLGRLELQAEVDQPGLQTGHERLELECDRGWRDDQELVRPGSAQDHGLDHLATKQTGDGQQRLIPGRMTVVLVEQPEVVDIDERDRHRHARRACGLGLHREATDHGSMVERPGERIAAGRLHQLRGLTGQATLGRPEDQEEQRRGDQRGGQRDEHDVTTNERQAIDDRHRIAPDRDDTEHLAIDADRQVLAQEGRRAENAGAGSR